MLSPSSAVRPLWIAAVVSFVATDFAQADDAAPAPFTQVPEVMPSQVRGQEPPVVVRPNIDWVDGPRPAWIWGVPDATACVLRTKFDGGAVKSAWLKATCDNVMRVRLNGKVVATSSEWQTPVEIDLLPFLESGENNLQAEVDNEGNVAGFLAKIVLEGTDGTNRFVVTSGEWEGATERRSKAWSPVRIVGQHGDGPWGDVLAKVTEAAGGVPRDVFELLAGFQVEKLYTVPKDELGSWVCITFDPQGRLLASDQGDKGICRITPAASSRESSVQSPEQTKVERLGLDISSAQGLLCAFGHLYISVNGGRGSGLYRAKYDVATDQYGPVEKLHEFRGGGEHGPHALRLSPDGKSIYVIAGNHTKPPFDPIRSGQPQELGGVRSDVLTATNPPGMSTRMLPNWDEDLLLPREWDPRGHARGILAPGGWIAKTDPEAKTWEIVSIGYRNPYDMAFNADGELFAYDADMEWDMGTPWYRPTRVMHATSGSDFGWRSATGKWPPWYIDALPPVVEIGPGSPVGVEFGYGTKFPAKYQRALYLCDWTFGTMYAIHLTPRGASYIGEKEEFLSRIPLPLTDAAVGPDGALYFTIGGRGTQSELFRVTYVGDQSTAPAKLEDASLAASRDRRHRLEDLQTGLTLETGLLTCVDDLRHAHESLTDSDRFIRYAAQTGFEQLARNLTVLPPGIRLSEHMTSPGHLAQFTTVIAKVGITGLRPDIESALASADVGNYSESQLLDYLRASSLLFIRLGAPDDATRQALISKLDPLYPAQSGPLNRELVQMLVYLESPTIVEKAVTQLGQAPPQSEVKIDPLLARNSGYGGNIADMLRHQPDLERMWIAFVLRNAKVGWTLDLKTQFYQFLSTARGWKGGASFQGFLDYIDNDVWDLTPEKERIAIEGAGVRKPYQLPELPKPQGPGHDWTLDEVIAKGTTGLDRGRDFKNGQRAFAAARCIVCHRFAGDGGATGPDLTQLAGRFNLKDLSDAILDPSKVVSDQYKATMIVTTGGQTYTGRLLGENGASLSMLIDPENASKVVDIPKANVETQQPSATSLMPKDLLKQLNENEVLDLLAYLLSRGDEGHAMFRK